MRNSYNFEFNDNENEMVFDGDSGESYKITSELTSDNCRVFNCTCKSFKYGGGAFCKHLKSARDRGFLSHLKPIAFSFSFDIVEQRKRSLRAWMTKRKLEVDEKIIDNMEKILTSSTTENELITMCYNIPKFL